MGCVRTGGGEQDLTDEVTYIGKNTTQPNPPFQGGSP